MSKNEKGFTLIELLVVVAIIALLASVVLASLRDARIKAKNASIKDSMNSVRNSAAIFYSGPVGNGTYGTADLGRVTSSGGLEIASGGWQPSGSLSGACGDSNMLQILKFISAQSGQYTYCVVGVNGASYEADTVLSDGTTFCVDSGGFIGEPTEYMHPIRGTTVDAKC